MWKLFQMSIMAAVMCGNIYYEWTPNPYLAGLLGVGAAFIATLLLSPLFRRRSPEPKQEPPNSVRSTVGARWDTNNLIEGVPRTWVSDDPRKLIEIPPERPRLESVVRSGPILPRRKTLGGYRLKPPAGH